MDYKERFRNILKRLNSSSNRETREKRTQSIRRIMLRQQNL